MTSLKHEEVNVKLHSLFPAARTRMTLVVLLCLAVLAVISLGQTGVGASALSLFQSPASPVRDAEPHADPAPVKIAEDAPVPSTEGFSIPTWAYFVAAVLVLVVAAVVLLLRSRR